MGQIPAWSVVGICLMRILIKRLLIGIKSRTPSESAMVPPNSFDPTDVTDYRGELALSLSSARRLMYFQVPKAQSKYKRYYDRKAKLS